MTTQFNTLILTAAAALITASAHAGEKLRVPTEFATIQAAIDFARPGDRIKIAPGFYDEDVVLDRTDLLLKGTDDTFVRSMFLANADRCVVRDMTLTGNRVQLDLLDSDDVRLRNLSLLEADVGLQVENCDRLIVETSDVIGCGVGIDVLDSSEVTIRKVLFEDNLGTSLDMTDSPRALIEECVLRETATIALETSPLATVRDNVLKESSLFMAECDNSLVQNNKIKNERATGMMLEDCEVVTVDANKIKKCGDEGIQVNDGTANRLSGNKIKRNDTGLRMNSLGNTVDNNKIKKNTTLDVLDLNGAGANTYIGNKLDLAVGI